MSKTVFMPSVLAKGIPCGKLVTVKGEDGNKKHYVTLNSTSEDKHDRIKVSELPVEYLNINTKDSSLPRLDIVG